MYDLFWSSFICYPESQFLMGIVAMHLNYVPHFSILAIDAAKLFVSGNSFDIHVPVIYCIFVHFLCLENSEQ